MGLGDTSFCVNKFYRVRPISAVRGHTENSVLLTKKTNRIKKKTPVRKDLERSLNDDDVQNANK